MQNPFKKHKDIEQKQAEIMEAIRKATEHGNCVILGNTPEGTRVIVLDKPLYQRQIEDIIKTKGG